MSLTTSIITGGSSNHETTSAEVNAIGTDFFSEGVVGTKTNTAGVAPATGAFAVNAQGSPNMTVAVSSGVAYVTATPTGQTSQLLRVFNSATENVTISANSSGSTKYDWVYLKIDPTTAADSNAAADNIATLVTSRSSNASTDDGTPPTYGILLAKVTVANGASSIANASIADARETAGADKLANGSVTSEKINLGYGSATVNTSETTTSTVYGDLATITDTVTVNVGSKGVVLLAISCQFANNTTNQYAITTFQASGANTIAASDTNAIYQKVNATPTHDFQFGRTRLLTGLTPGSTTFKLKYRTTGGTASFANRNISVVVL